MKQTEQIHNKQVLIDYDEKFSPKDMINILQKFFVVKNNKNPYIIKIGDTDVKIFLKQVTYLGHPHPIFKKRIQISAGWNTELIEKNAFLLGIYKYKDTIIFTHFDKTNFIHREVNNSSAHVYSFDLLKATEDGIFRKTDIRGNQITTIRDDKIVEFFEEKVGIRTEKQSEIDIFEKLKNRLPKECHGISAYKEMISKNFSQKFQSEWGGFFVEFKFQELLQNEPDLQKICTFQSNKKNEDIDLDINFHNKFLGDLKTHSNDSSGILGNDKDNIFKALQKYGKIWYIVFSHNTIKDSEKNFEVTIFWNTAQNKENLMSYSKKMKNTLIFTDFKILEINNYNKNYLSDFNQGRNSNGNARKQKISIKARNINNFLIHYSKF